MHVFQGCDPEILKQLLQEQGLKYDQTSVSYVFTCPKCASKKKLYMRKRDGRFVCWKCKETENYQGRPEYALADLLGWPVKVVRSKLYGGDHIQVDIFLDVRLADFFGDDEELDEEAVQVPTTSWPAEYYPIDDEFATRGADYLRSRGILIPQAADWGVHYSPVKRRVVFPVQADGKLYGWQERTVLPKETIEEHNIPKILSSTGIPRDRTLMFADNLRGSSHAILTEGPIDAMKCGPCGGAVAAMGKAVSTRQVELLIYAGVRKLYLGLDPDAAEEIQRLVRLYNSDFELYSLVAPVKGAKEKPDLGAMDYRDVYELFLAAPRIDPGRLFVYTKQPVEVVKPF